MEELPKLATGGFVNKTNHGQAEVLVDKKARFAGR
jgi:hypothetical protein